MRADNFDSRAARMIRMSRSRIRPPRFVIYVTAETLAELDPALLTTLDENPPLLMQESSGAREVAEVLIGLPAPFFLVTDVELASQAIVAWSMLGAQSPLANSACAVLRSDGVVRDPIIVVGAVDGERKRQLLRDCICVGILPEKIVEVCYNLIILQEAPRDPRTITGWRAP